MKRTLMIIAILSIVVATAWPDIGNGATPLLKNGGFEEVNPQNTSIPAEWGGSGSGVKLSKDNPHSGNYCLLLESSGKVKAAAQGEVKNLIPNKYYQLTFFYRTQGNIEDLSILVDVSSQTGIPESNCWLKGATDWQAARIVLYSDTGNSTTLYFSLNPGKTTTKVWFDDIVLDEMDANDFKSALLLDSGFEAGESGMIPVGWSRGWFDDSRFTERYARCEVDGTESHTGSHSLRVDFSQNGYFILLSDTRIILPDLPYTFSIWAKANREGVPLRLTARGPAYAEKTFLLGQEWRKLEFTFTIPKEKLDASISKGVQVTFGWEETNSPATILWVDDAAWEIAGKKDDEDQRENFLPNGSFEFASNPSFSDFWGCYFSSAFVPFYQVQTRDNHTAVAGIWSHKIKAKAIDFMGAKSLRGSELEVRFQVPTVTSPTDYVLSVYLKSDREDMKVNLFAFSGEKMYVTTVKLTTEWRRYTLNAPLDAKSPRGDDGTGTKVIVSIRPETEGTYWIDAAQFEKGTVPTLYQEAAIDAVLYQPVSTPSIPAEDAFPAVEAVRSNSNPRIDGKLNDPIWKQAAHVGDFILNRDRVSAKQQTEAWLIFTPNALCVAFKCYDDRMNQIKADVKERNGPIQQDDCVDFLVNPTNDPDAFFQFALNPINTQFCHKEGGDISLGKWDADWKSAVSKGRDCWTAELSIPLSSLELSQSLPATWRINFCRENQKANEYSEWSFTQGSFLNPERFGNLTGILPDWLANFYWKISGNRLLYREPATGLFNLTFDIENLTGQPQEIIVSAALTAITGQKTNWRIQLKDQSLQVKAGTSETLSADLKLDRAAASNYQLDVQVKEKKSKIILYQKRNDLSIPEIFTAYFQRSFYMNEAAAILQANLSGCSESLLRNLSLSLSIAGPSGQKIEKRAGFINGPRTQINIDISNLSEGAYPATIEVLDSSGVQISSKKDILTKLPYKPYAVPVDRDTRTILVDGKPFLPYFLGIGSAHLARNLIPEVAAAGFNGIIGAFNVFSGDTQGSDEEIRLFLDDCRRYGLKFIWWLEAGHSGEGLKAIAEANLRWMEHIIPKFREDPTVIAWKFADEWWDEKLSGKLYRRCHELDPHRPAYINGVDITDVSKWLELPDLNTDIESVDIYPFGLLQPLPDIEGVARCADNMMRIGGCSRMPGYFWLQGGIGYGEERWFREPIPAEQDAMLYLLKLHGLTGFYYFFGRPNAKENWEAMSRLARELKTVDPLLLGIDPNEQLRLFLPNIHATIVKQQRGLYLFVVHSAPASCRFWIPFDAWGEKVGDHTSAKALFEDRKVTINNNILSDSFTGYGRHIYLIKD